MNAPRFSLVIVHRNGTAMLRETLLAALAAMGPEDELIVVDNGSQDESLAMVRRDFPSVRLIANGCNAGYARACNQGLALASGRYLLFLNNDAILPQEALDRFAADFAADPQLALIGAQLVAPDGTLQRSCAPAPTWLSEMGLRRRRISSPQPDTHGLIPVETLVGACMAARRDAIATAGPMDEDFFFYYEETEWCVRLIRHGWRVAIDPRVRVVHRKGASTRSVKKGAEIEALRSRLLYYRKTMPRHVATLLIFWRVVRLVWNTSASLLFVVATLGALPRPRQRLVQYARQLLWLLLGAPAHWGLPDKCPR